MENEFNREVGKRIFDARKALRLSRAGFGKKVGLHESSIKKYEDGNIKYLDVEKLKEFAAALDLTPAYLMGWDSAEATMKAKDGFESRLLVLARQSGSRMTHEQKEKLLKSIENTIDIYLDAAGLADDESLRRGD